MNSPRHCLADGLLFIVTRSAAAASRFSLQDTGDKSIGRHESTVPLSKPSCFFLSLFSFINLAELLTFTVNYSHRPLLSVVERWHWRLGYFRLIFMLMTTVWIELGTFWIIFQYANFHICAVLTNYLRASSRFTFCNVVSVNVTEHIFYWTKYSYLRHSISVPYSCQYAVIHSRRYVVSLSSRQRLNSLSLSLSLCTERGPAS